MQLLIPESVLLSAVGALPGNAVTGHPPQIFLHAGHADTEAAPALPAEWERLPAAMTQTRCLHLPPFSVRGYRNVVHIDFKLPNKQYLKF